MAKSAMPVSKAKTAYGLLSEIRKLIIEEPKRYDQGEAFSAPQGALAPKCGTVCCVGGWVLELTGESARFQSIDVAWEILGEPARDKWELFEADKAGPRHGADGFITTESLLAHAKRGAAHIASFQKKYAKQLKAKRV